jgi:dienelactone hydrolase
VEPQPAPTPITEDVTKISGDFVLTGNPESVTGAKWTYKETGATVYDLQGILYKPAGNGPFPAVIINHGTGGNVNGYSANVAKEVVKWGYVCIATNYTHASNVACGSPGLCDESAGDWGASEENILRAMKTWGILTSLSYVNASCIACMGHSRGAFLTTAIAGSYPDKFKVFAHTAGGISDVSTNTEPTTALAKRINKPYIIHHGDQDVIVSLAWDQKLSELLTGKSVPNSFYIYSNYSHQDISLDATMFARTRQWFELYNCK